MLKRRRRRSKPYDHILQLSTTTCGHNKKLQRYSADFPSLSSTNCDFELALLLIINTDFLSVPNVSSISTEELVLLRQARCVPSRLRRKEHTQLLSSYQFIIGKIENPYCSACRHSSQDTYHLILHCPPTDPLRRSLFGDSLRPLVQAIGSCPASGARWSSAMPLSLTRDQVTTTAKLKLQTHYYVTKEVSKFRHFLSCKQNYVTICNLLSQDSITNYLYTRNAITYKNSIY